MPPKKLTLKKLKARVMSASILMRNSLQHCKTPGMTNIQFNTMVVMNLLSTAEWRTWLQTSVNQSIRLKQHIVIHVYSSDLNGSQFIIKDAEVKVLGFATFHRILEILRNMEGKAYRPYRPTKDCIVFVRDDQRMCGAHTTSDRKGGQGELIHILYPLDEKELITQSEMGVISRIPLSEAKEDKELFNEFCDGCQKIGATIGCMYAGCILRFCNSLCMAGHECNGNKCGACKKLLTGHKCCPKCKSVYYCERSCQLAHWKTHKTECTKMAEIALSRKPPDPISITSSGTTPYTD